MSMTEFRKVLGRQLSEPEVANEEKSTSLPKRAPHKLLKPRGPGRKKRKMCNGCYKKLRLTMDSRAANKKVSKVTSFYADCPNQPGMCLDCFNELLKN